MSVRKGRAQINGGGNVMFAPLFGYMIKLGI